MRLVLSVLVSVVLSAASVGAQDSAKRDEAMPRHVIRSKSAPVRPMAAWTDGATLRSASGKEAVAKAPPSASRYESKAYKFPSGTIEVLTAAKDGAVLKQIGAESQLYVIKGTAEVTVAGAVTPIAAGDVVSQPSGVLRSTSADGAVIVAYTVGSSSAQPKSTVVRGKDVADIKLAQWMKDGKQVNSQSDAEFAAAPADAQIHMTKRYEFDGNSLRVPFWEKKKGSPDVVNTPVVPKETALLYIWQGEGRFTYGGQINEIYAGDALEEEAGVPHGWVVKESMKFTATDALNKRQ